MAPDSTPLVRSTSIFACPPWSLIVRQAVSAKDCPTSFWNFGTWTARGHQYSDPSCSRDVPSYDSLFTTNPSQPRRRNL
ncbi:hypothetical protein BDW69DRAFT_91998 [Aspergillus filifer]